MMPFKQLLIIGNGFDIACGLPSKYIDYFNFLRDHNTQFNDFCVRLADIKYPKRTDMKLVDAICSDLFSISNLNLWEIVFTLYDWRFDVLMTDKTWKQIEHEIKIFTTYSDVSDSTSLYCWESIYNMIAHLVENPSMYSSTPGYTLQLILAKYLMSKGLIKKPFIEFDDYILHQLYDFEKRFSSYIYNCENNTPNFAANANALAKKLTGSDIFDVCSFNYTKPFSSRGVINCHGLASDCNIIFGIESFKTKLTPYYKTRTYFYTKEAQKINVLSKGTKVNQSIDVDYNEIHFYGLSFSEQDYDYIHQIFETYDLGKQNKTRFIFWYSIYEPKEEQNIRENFNKSVMQLVNNYGEKMHIDNLLSKMYSTSTIDINELK